MFFKRGEKKSAERAVSGPAISVSTIPEVFYGGNNPEPVSVNVSANKKITAVSSSEPNKTHTRLVAAGMIAIFLTACAGAGWYYWNYLSSDGTTSNIVTETVTTVPAADNPSETKGETAVPVPTDTPTTTEPVSDAAASTSTALLTPTLPSLTDLPFEFPSLNQIDASDFDADGLTDLEEEIYGTDPAAFDSDKDEYNDGQEVLNLYNPKGVAPVRIADSGLVREYAAPNALYRFYYPVLWTIGAVDAAGTNILITAANGDYIEVRQSPKRPGEDFNTWFGRTAVSEKITDLETSLNRFGTSFYKRKDGLVAYINGPQQVIVLLYHPESNAPIHFRKVMQMLLESLRVTGVSVNPTAE